MLVYGFIMYLKNNSEFIEYYKESKINKYSCRNSLFCNSGEL